VVVVPLVVADGDIVAVRSEGTVPVAAAVVVVTLESEARGVAAEETAGLEDTVDVLPEARHTGALH
jgi:hypothetical protein